MQMRWLDLRHRVTLAEAKLADLKIALEDMRAQRDAWQAMAQARIRPARRPARAGGYGFGQPDDKVKARGPASEGMDAMQIELSNFQPLAANEAIEQEVPDLGGAEQLSAPMIEESDQGLASLIRSVGMTSITDIDNLVSELQDARDYLQSEGERIRAEVAHYAALAGAASASVKIIFDVLRAWRTTGHPAHNQSQASAFELRTL